MPGVLALVATFRNLAVSRRTAPKNLPAANGRLLNIPINSDELHIVLDALWVWQAQLGRIGSDQAIPGLANTEFRLKVQAIVRKLGGEPESHLFGFAQSAAEPSNRGGDNA